MLNRLRRWIAPPVFEDDEKTRVASLLNRVLLSLIVVVVAHTIIVILFIPLWRSTLYLPISFILFHIGLLALMRKGYIRSATLSFCIFVWLAISFTLYSGGGVENPVFAAYTVVITVAGLLLGDKAAVGFGVLCIVTGVALAGASERGLLPVRADITPVLVVVVHAVTLAGLVAMLVITVRSTQSALRRARASERELAERNEILEAEIARREQAEEAYRTLVEHSIQGLFIQQDGRIIFANQAEVDILGYSLQELLALEDVTVLVHPEDRVLAAEQTAQLLAGDVPAERLQLRIVRPDGEVRWVEIYPSPITFRDRPAIQAAAVDITERMHSEQQELELRLAREKADLLGDFISNISHDLGTPLSVINTSLYLLERITDPAKQKDRLDTIKEQALLLERLIQDILTSSRLDHLPLPTFTPVDLNRVLSHAIDKLRPMGEKKNIAVTFSPSSASAFTLADEHELNRAFTNLLENAIKYTPEGGTITARISDDGGKRLVQIKDSGIGIDASELPHIFDRFYRANAARSSTITGTGLGLSIVHQIIDMHAGTIECTSVLEQGTTFHVRLPATEEA